MSRLFNGSTDIMGYNIPASGFDPTDSHTVLIVFRIMTTSDTSWLSLIEIEDSGLENEIVLGRNGSGNIHLLNDGDNPWSTTPISDADNWMVLAATKGSGTVTPRLHKYPIGGSPTHTDFPATVRNAGSVASGTLHIGGDDDAANIKLAAAAVWVGTALTDGQIDGIATTKTTQAIADLSPTWLVDDSDAFATDLIGSMDRTTLSGTSDDADDPSGWVYGLGGAPGASQRFMWMP